MADVLPGGGARHSILDLAPLELDCMNALWPAGEATVRHIQQALYPTRPRAYTTIMTILDRLAQKGIVLRRKAGRAWVYRPNLTEQEARSQALAQLVNGFFAGSNEGLAKHLAAQGQALPAMGFGPEALQTHPPPSPAHRSVRQEAERRAPETEGPASPELDASLL